MKLHFRILSVQTVWLACALLSPAMAAHPIVQASTESGSVELSNLDTEDATHELLVVDTASPVAERKSGTAAASRNPSESLAGQGLDEIPVHSPRPKHGELQVLAKSGEAENAEPLPVQQQYQDLMLQQASFNGGHNGNFASARKYLKVDRESYFNAANQ